MPGLLDARGGFNDPITMGLLGASQALLTPMSQGGGLGAAFGAFPAAQQAAEANRYKQMLQAYQMRKMQQEDEDRQAARDMDAQIKAAARNSFGQLTPGSLGGGIAPGSQQGRMLLESMSGDPEFDQANLGAINSAANTVGPQQAVSAPTFGFDQNKFFNELVKVSPLKALELRKSLQGESPWAKINPEKFTQESVARFAATGNPADLVAATDSPRYQFYQGVPGNDYRPDMPPVVFDPRTGTWSIAPNPTPQQPLAGRSPTAPAAVPPIGGSAGSPPPQAPAITPEPADPLAPWNGLPPKRADDVRVREGDRIRRQLDTERENLRPEAVALSKMDQFGTLNRRTATGDALSKTLPSVSSFVSSDKSSMQSLTASMAPREREPGSGSSTDRDMALFVQAVPSIDKEGPVNEAIRNARRAQYNRDVEYINAKEAYFARRGHISGFDAEWQKYANEVPLFANDATPDDFKLNRAAITFEKWQKGGARSAPTQPAQSQTGIGTQSVSGQVLDPKVTNWASVLLTAQKTGKTPEQVRQDLVNGGWTIR
jgi:hypothetical protein